MSDEKKRSASSDIEYEYPNEDVGQESLTEPPQKAVPSFAMIRDKLLERLPKKKKLRVLIIIGVAIYIVYKFLSASSPSSAPTSAPERIVSQSLSKPAEVAAPVQEEVQPAVEVKPVSKPLALTEEKDLSDHLTTEQVSEMKKLQSSLDQMNQYVTSLQSSLLNLTNSVVGLSNKVGSLEKMRLEEKRVALKHPLDVYYLQSLIPQRAWLYSPGREFITVKVGDLIPGYGQVQKINVQTGIVSTSSGRTISYGPNDS